MARPLRIEVSGGVHHLTARGNERKPIYRDTRDREHFLELLAELPTRFGTLLHACVLMNNHYHLVIETPEPNLSRVGQWLNQREALREYTVESVKGENWEAFRDRYGDWGRDAALYLGRRQGRMKLTELSEAVGGIDYAAVGGAISRLSNRLAKGDLGPEMKKILSKISNS